MAHWSLANLAAWAVQVMVLVAAGVWLPARLGLGTPRSRVILFRVLLIACIALPLVQPRRPAPSVPVTIDLSQVPAPDLAASGAPGAATSPLGAVERPSMAARAYGWLQSLPWSRSAVVVLVGGGLLRLAWLGLGLVSLARLRRRSMPIDPDLPSIREAERAVGAGAAFREGSRVARPVTFGLRRPVVLVPPGFASLETGHQLAIACHELLHVRRQDWLRVLGDEIVRALLWFHPAIWWLVEQIHLSTEQMIDRRAVEMIGDRRSYLRALLALAGASTGPRLQPAACFLDHGHLRQRVAMLMEEASMSRVRLVASVVTVVTVVAAGGWWSVRAFPLQGAAAPQVATASPSAPTFALAAAPIGGTMATRVPVAVSETPAPTTAAEPTASPAPQAQAPRPGMTTAPADFPPDEATLKQRIQMSPKDTSNYFVLAYVLEKSGDLARAAAMLEAAANVAPRERNVYLQLVSFYNRNGNFDKVAESLGRWTAIDPGDATAQYTMACYYWEKAYRDTALTEWQKRELIDRGLQAVDAAIAVNSEFMEALTYKNLLLRLQAQIESDPAAQKALVTAADKLRQQAIAIRNARQAAGIPTETYPAPKVPNTGGGTYATYAAAPPLPPPPPPPPSTGVAGGISGGVAGGVPGGVTGGVAGGVPGVPPPPPPPVGADGKVAPVRVGGNIPPPTKIVDVKPVYPEDALQAKAQGVVIIEVTLDEAGKVSNARILRSISLFDQAALDAVKQWEFTPTLVSGVSVPVIMVVTVNFTLDK